MEEVKYRVMIGADGDDYVYANGLNYDDTLDVKNKVQLIPGAYSYIEKDN